jgi:hypothetical protein
MKSATGDLPIFLDRPDFLTYSLVVLITVKGRFQQLESALKITFLDFTANEIKSFLLVVGYTFHPPLKKTTGLP